MTHIVYEKRVIQSAALDKIIILQGYSISVLENDFAPEPGGSWFMVFGEELDVSCCSSEDVGLHHCRQKPSMIIGLSLTWSLPVIFAPLAL